jgi:HSP20 family protein
MVTNKKNAMKYIMKEEPIMSSLIPYSRNKNRGALTPFQVMRSIIEEPLFSDFGIVPFAWAGSIRADVKDLGKEYLVEADLPGVPKDKIAIDVHEGILTISANEEVEQKEEKSDYVYRERRWGHVSRSFSLDNINENDIKAEYKDGVLSVHLPKAEPEKKSARKIDIQ